MRSAIHQPHLPSSEPSRLRAQGALSGTKAHAVPTAAAAAAAATSTGFWLHVRRRHARLLGRRTSHRSVARAATAEATVRGSPANGAESTAEDDNYGGVDVVAAATTPEALERLSTLDQALWPLLLVAAEAEAASVGGSSEALGGALARAARGLGAWRDALAHGRIWEDGADWPANPSLRSEWTQLLRDLNMPSFTRRYPKLLDPLLSNLLEAVERFEVEAEEQSPGQEEQPGDRGSQAGQGEPTLSEDDVAAQMGQVMQDGKDGNSTEADAAATQEARDGDHTNADSAARAAAAMQDLREKWGGAAEAIRGAEEAFGGEGADAVASGIGQGVWHETAAWKEVSALQALLSKQRELRELIRNLGRRSSVKGPLRRLPEEVDRPGQPPGVVRSSAAPAEANGVRLSGDWDAMLPSEAQLLAAKRPVLRTLHHMRRIERSLLSYDRTAWLEEEARVMKRMETRPLGKAGPLILCLDTSGSMQGYRETLSKALVLESLRQAHRQKRRCYLYAFSGMGQLQELELDMSAQGLQRLLNFLKFSFSGGTTLDDALRATAERLSTEEEWRNADVMLVTDGELCMPAEAVMQNIEEASAACGARLVGLVLGDKAGEVMEKVCSELYTTGNPEPREFARLRSDKGMRRATTDGWPQLRRVQAQRKLVARAVGFGKNLGAISLRCIGATTTSLQLCGSSFMRGSSNLRAHLPFSHYMLASRSVVGRNNGADTDCSGDRKPDYSRYASDLILVIQQADVEARRLKQRVLGTESLLLGILSAPVTAGLRDSVFVDGTATVQLARAFVEGRLVQDKETPQQRKSKSIPPPLQFTPLARRALLRAEEEQERLGHRNVEAAHLFLGMLCEPRGDACQMLGALKADVELVRLEVLATLQGTMAKVRLVAGKQIMASRQKSRDVAPQKEEYSLARKLFAAHQLLTEGLVERSVEAKLLLLAALGGEHVFLLGPPGTAKSLLARRLARVCKGAFFERLLTRFSVPEEVFGPLSLKALENDELRRKVDGFLPDADVAFLDEIFKANSSILNALLSLLNERVFDNGGSRMEVPLWCAVAASNELPESDDLDALYDRFLLRRAVPRVSDAALLGFLQATLRATEPCSSAVGVGTRAEGEAAGRPPLSAADSATAREAAATSVQFPERLLQSIAQLRSYLRDEAEPPVLISDRRLGKAVRLLRVAAYAAGASDVSELDLLLLQHIFWDRDPQQAQVVRDWIFRHLAGEGSGSSKEDRVVPQVLLLLAGVQKRLKQRLKQVTVDTARGDLENLRLPLEEELSARRSKLAALQAQLADTGKGNLRTFWLEPADIEEAADKLVPSAEAAIKAAESTLCTVLELLAALSLSDLSEVQTCLGGLLGQQAIDGSTRDGVEGLNKWAATFKLSPS